MESRRKRLLHERLLPAAAAWLSLAARISLSIALWPAPPATSGAARAAEPGSDQAPPAGFRRLFDGRSLEGWHAAPRLGVPPAPVGESAGPNKPPPAGPVSKLQREARGHWEARDGMIVGGQDEQRAKKPNGDDWGLGSWLMTDATFGDFELLVDARPDWPCDTGIYVRSTPLGQGYQVLLDHRGDDGDGVGGSIGFLYLRGIGGLRVSPYDFRWRLGDDGLPRDVEFAPGKQGVTRVEYAAANDDFRRAWRMNDWNRFHIRVVGELPRITIWINEVKICECDTAAIADPRYDPAAVKRLLGPRGHIAFEVHDGPAWRWGIGNVSRWRNVFIKELAGP